MKKALEEAFDIPFRVRKGISDYTITPENEFDELFTIKIEFRSGVRMIAEIGPQKHAADMLRDFESVSAEKQNLFRCYLDQFRTTGATVNVKVNNIETDLTEWPMSWKTFYIRINKLDPDIVFEAVAKEWAVLAAGMMLSLLTIVPLTDYEEEGAMSRITSNKYERSRLNRTICLRIHGYACKVCGMTFESVYGEIGRKFIHVHHIEPVSQMGGSYVLNPAKDLVPVCPNCHAMLHTKNPPYLPEELKKIFLENKS